MRAAARMAPPMALERGDIERHGSSRLCAQPHDRSAAGLAEFFVLAGAPGLRRRRVPQRPAGSALFDGTAPADAAAGRGGGLRLLAVAEVKRFNDWPDDGRAEAAALTDMRRPRGRGGQPDPGQRRHPARATANGRPTFGSRCKALKPMLRTRPGRPGRAAGLRDLLAALQGRGGRRRSRRSAAEAASGWCTTRSTTPCRRRAVFPEHTGIVHVSGVVDPSRRRGGNARRAPGAGRRRRTGSATSRRSAALHRGRLRRPVPFERFRRRGPCAGRSAEAIRRSMDVVARGLSVAAV